MIASMRRLLRVLCLMMLALSVVSASAQLPQSNPAAHAAAPLLRDALEHGRAPSGVALRQIDDLRRFYAARDFQPAWIGAGSALVLATLSRTDEEGLDSADYRTRQLDGSVEEELRLSDTLFHYARDVYLGRVPSSTMADYARAPFDFASALSRALASGTLADFLAYLPPANHEYRELKVSLAFYRALAAKHGWQVIPAEGSIKLDAHDPRIDALRRRLRIEDPLLSDARNDPGNKELEAAVRRYQERNALEVDGRAGRQTIEALNVPPAARVDQIIANMERWRWLPRTLGSRYIMVNSADATLMAVSDGNVVLNSHAIVGKRTTPTPMFSANAVAVTVNPFWNIPDPIARNEMLPKLRHNANYLASQHIEIVDGAAGDPYGTGIDWRSTSRTNFHYTLRQLPGADNALGYVKLEMPNRFNSYLHDTPSRSLFAKSDRHFSHGCMRVEQIRPLASFALTGDTAAGLEKLQNAIDSGETKQLPLDRPLPVYIVYWTAIASQDGTAGFRSDIYGRDARLLAALAGQSSRGLTMNTTECSAAAG